MKDNLLVYLSGEITRKRQAGKNSTADLYRATGNHLRTFVKVDSLPFSDITPTFVEQFDTYLCMKGLAVNSVNSYLSCFRAIYNLAVRNDVISPEKHPFRFLRLKREAPAKRALPLAVLKEVCHLKLPKKELVRSLDFYLFSFLSCGMPFADMAHLTWDNIVNNEIIYKRRKTGVQIRVGITEGIRKLLYKYSDPKSHYVFPQFCGAGSHEAYKSVLANHNACLREIGSRLSNPVRLTSYTARHSWATEALRQNTPIAIISQALGHTSEKTTRFYLGLLDQSELDEANRRITQPIAELIKKTG